MEGKKRNPFLFFWIVAAIITIGLPTTYVSLRKNSNIGQKENNKTVTENLNENKNTKNSLIETNKIKGKPEMINNREKIKPESRRNIKISNGSNLGNPVNRTPSDPIPQTITEKSKDELSLVPPGNSAYEDSIKSIKLRKAEKIIVAEQANVSNPQIALHEDSVKKASSHDAGKTPSMQVRKAIDKHLLSIYLNFSPSLLDSRNTSLSDSNDLTTHKYYAGLKSNGEKMKNSLGFSLGVKYSPFNKIAFSTGLIYEQREEKVNYQFVRDEAPVIIQATGEIVGYIHLTGSAAQKVNYTGTNTYAYLGVPIIINYAAFQLGRLGLGIDLSTNFISRISLKGTTINKGNLKLESLSDINSTQLKNIFNGGLGLNFSYGITRNFIINIIPDYKVQFNKSSKTSRPMQAELNVGIQYKIL
jgi:hypothetical protein